MYFLFGGFDGLDEYADVYLQSADQIEDQLTPNTIASGFCEKPILKVSGFHSRLVFLDSLLILITQKKG